VQTLSKGQTQKVQLVAVLISKPQLVLLDEPFSGLDPVNAVVLRDAILDLKRAGTTVIFSTHDMSVAEKMCDTIVMIYRGRKVLDGTLQQIKSNYGHDTLRVRLVGATGEASLGIPALPGVESVTDFGQYQELRLARDADHQSILHALIPLGRLELFEVAHPSLQDIFVRIAAPGAEAMAGAA
jgi:ABC-2 type transport system ATP-binding protein